VTAIDPDGVEHTVEVAAESLFEAAGLALCALRSEEWAPPPGLRLRISVRQPVVEHVVEVRRFESWLTSTARSPRERIVKERLKAMLSGGS
jgi:hypothetical protein